MKTIDALGVLQGGRSGEVRIGPWSRGAAYALVFLSYFLYTIGQFDHNDFMYAVSPTFKGVLYADVHYVQAPLSFYFLKLLAILSPEGATYTLLRLSSVILSCAALLVVAEGCLSVDSVKLVFIVLAVTNYFFACGAFEIGSYALPVFFLACALALSLGKVDLSLRTTVLIGLFVGLAGSSKINHVLFGLPFLLFVLLRAGSKRLSIVSSLAFLAGFALGSLPLAFHLIENPLSFISHDILFHSRFTNDARGLDLRLSVKSVISALLAWLNQGGLYLAALSCLGLWRCLTSRSISRYDYLLVLACFYVSFLVAFSAAIGLKQYYVTVSFFAILCAAYALQFEIAIVGRQGVAAGLFVGAIIIHQLLNFVPALSSALRAGPVTAEVSAISHSLSESLSAFDRGRCSPTVFTYSGAFAIDSGLILSRYTEGGVFWTRLNGFVPEKYVDDGRYGIERGLLDPEDFVRGAKDVNVVIVGFYADLSPAREGALLAAARARGFKHLIWIVTRLSPRPLDVWVNPACMTESWRNGQRRG